MRVAILTDNDFDKVNGVTTTLKAVLALAPDDISPHVYTFADDDSDRGGYTALGARGMPISFYPDMRIYLPRVAALRARLRQDRVAAVHLTTPGPAGLAARHLAATLRLPLIGSYHTELGEYARRLSGSRHLGLLIQTYMRWLYGTCRQLLVPSAATRDVLIDSGWCRERFRLWPRGVDPDRFSPLRRSAVLRERWGVSDACPAVLYAGRLSREKGLDLLPRLEALLNEYRMRHRLILCGDGPYRRELQAALPEAIFTGTVPHDVVGEMMASADIFLFPSETDTAGNVVLEAQAAGLPVLVTSLGGPRENMVPYTTGHVCQAGRAEDFCWRVAELIVDRDRRTQMSRAAREFALTRRWADAMVPLFRGYRDIVRAAAADSNRRAVSRGAPAPAQRL